MEIYMIGIDLAKTNFSLHAVDRHGKCKWRKSLKRSQMLGFFSNHPAVKISMEACGGCHYWSRKFQEMGHEVFIIAAQYVKPFVKSQKNDRNDAEAIVEAAMRPNMRFVPTKQIWQQDLQTLHRVRQRVLDARVTLSNQARGLLLEYGVTINKGVSAFKTMVPLILEDAEENLSALLKSLLNDLYEEFKRLEAKKKEYDVMVKNIAEENEDCMRLMQVPGVGPLVSTAFVSGLGDPNHYKNGRQVGAWLGLVPRQFSTGGKTKLGRITKRGDSHIRQLLIHGARSYLSTIRRKGAKNRFEEKQLKMWEKKGYNKTSVAMANRNARVMWSLLKYKEDYNVA